MKIQGLLQTTCPIHLAVDANSLQNGDAKGTETGTYHSPVFNPETGKINQVPGISATHLRGCLRHLAHDIYIEQYRARGITISANLFNSQRHGSANGAIARDDMQVQTFLDQRQDPLAACFGGGPRMLPGAVSTAAALVICKETANRPHIAKFGHISSENLPFAFQFVGHDHGFNKIDMVHGLDASDILNDYVEAVQAFIAASDERKTTKAAENAEPSVGAKPKAKKKTERALNEDGTKVSYLRARNIINFQYLIEGSLLPIDLRCDNAMPEHVKGFFIEVARRFFEEGRIGGMQRLGFGINAFNLETVANLMLDGSPLFFVEGEEVRVLSGTEARRYHDAFAAWRDSDASWAPERLYKGIGMEVGKVNAGEDA